MRLSKALALALPLAAGAAAPAGAADLFSPAPLLPEGWIVTLKGNLKVGPSYPGADDFGAIAFPSLSLRRAGTPERFGAPDDGLSFSLLEDSALRVGVVGRFQGGRYLKDDRRLFGLRKIDWAVEPGVFVEFWPLQFLRARAELRHGVNGHHGFVADLGLDLVQTYGALTFSAGPRLALGDGSFARTYFGVTPAEAALNGQVTPYKPSGGITSVGATAGVTYTWSAQWSTTAHVTYKRLVGDAADSPIVKRFGSENQLGFGLTAAYSFGAGR
ncbi:MipA/OmpV family protein [Microvirga thermotolerans]|uniref:MipA/OmpV family protein n=1 Tax=Microvirga thermotolerans TaxID=2651334 RepID=A0A5P9JQD3_9HYPH|nr:MipA/OmpV family protein [Microvirga thermotolerans]QFU14847.1 MipA/OmpV family protein [Microvirga thermotolerans]